MVDDGNNAQIQTPDTAPDENVDRLVTRVSYQLHRTPTDGRRQRRWKLPLLACLTLLAAVVLLWWGFFGVR